jgi:hypothetical protein
MTMKLKNSVIQTSNSIIIFLLHAITSSSFDLGPKTLLLHHVPLGHQSPPGGHRPRLGGKFYWFEALGIVLVWVTTSNHLSPFRSLLSDHALSSCRQHRSSYFHSDHHYRTAPCPHAIMVAARPGHELTSCRPSDCRTKSCPNHAFQCPPISSTRASPPHHR